MAAAVAAMALGAPAVAGAHGSLQFGLGVADPPSPVPSSCPSSVDPAGFETTGRLLADNRVMARLGRRPTASPQHVRFVNWLAGAAGRIPGLRVESIPYTVDRWLERGARISAGPEAGELSALPDAGAVPYSQPTPKAGVGAPLVTVPAGTSIAGDAVKGKIVVRDAVPGTVPNAAFAALEWFSWDPDLQLTTTLAGNYERDYLGYQQRIDDLKAAAEAGAAGLVFVHGFPRSQVRGQYAPYEGIRWKVPAIQVGADEGAQLKELAARGGAARLRVAASERRAPTRTLVATLPGASDERIVIESHTDGMNAIWDNGPIAILALARYFAALPRECRARTLQFVFTTGHLYQHLVDDSRGGGAEQIAAQIDREYDQGGVALVLALEHMGAQEYAAQPRADGGPGRVLVQTGQHEPTGIFVGESPVLVGATSQAVVGRDLRKTIVLRGADLPGARIPPHQSFGGEGTEYQQHLIPTIALVTGPWSLYNPAFGMEAIDGDLMRRQALVFGDLVHALGAQPREALGGGYLGYRAARSALCSSAFATLGLAHCSGPYG
jgi:hypothetical protein